MKYLIASDLHGSYFYAQKLNEVFVSENADMLILLGDIYNHGPRNQLPKDYSPMQVAELLNRLKDKLVVVKGNCDSAVDTMISDFDFIENMVVTSGKKTVFLTHGHIYNKDSLPKTRFNAIVYGHFHTPFVESVGDTVAINVGSLSLPKNGTANSYSVLENGVITVKDFEGNVIETAKM